MAKKTNVYGDELEIDFMDNRKQGPMSENITQLTERTREKFGVDIPEPTMFDDD
jgi:hypothetical protein